MSRVIGIVPTANLFLNDDLYEDKYSFVNNYVVRVEECGGIPMGILAKDGRAIEKSLEKCDALLLCGGKRIYPYHFEAVEHAVKTGKPLLGICLGLQTLHSYFVVEDEAKKRSWTGSMLELYTLMKKEKHMFTLPVEHHWDVPMVRGNEDGPKHPVQVKEGTFLHRLTGRTELMGASMHRYRVNEPSPRLTVCAQTEDGTIEGLEYEERLLGIQFHPEVDKELENVFRFVCGTL